jgi:hypothetical protein
LAVILAQTDCLLWPMMSPRQFAYRQAASIEPVIVLGEYRFGALDSFSG